MDVGRKVYGVESEDLRSLFRELTG